ncbi:hypothetical protein AB0J27_05370 [Micromonospora chokoriensis]
MTATPPGSILRLPGAVDWLAKADGVYEESRLPNLLADLTPAPLAGA